MNRKVVSRIFNILLCIISLRVSCFDMDSQSLPSVNGRDTVPANTAYGILVIRTKVDSPSQSLYIDHITITQNEKLFYEVY